MANYGDRVRCIETGQVFRNTTAAGEFIGRAGNTIRRAIQREGTAGGFHWEYAYEAAPAPSPLSQAAVLELAAEPEPKQLGGNRRRPVLCVETGEQYTEVKLAARAAGVTETTMGRIIRELRTSPDGRHWCYADQPLPSPSEYRETATREKPVLCVETGLVFGSHLEAARFCGGSRKGIGEAVRRGVKCRGYYWCPADVDPHDWEPLKSTLYCAEKRHIRRNCRPVRCVETGEVFQTAGDAAATIGEGHGENIRAAIKAGKTRGGYHWRYADDE